MTSFSLFHVLFHIIIIVKALSTNYELSESLTPYKFQHGSHMSHRDIRDCHKTEFGSPPHELHPVSHSTNGSAPYIVIKRIVKEIQSLGTSFPNKKTIRGHYVVVSDPLKTVSVLEPDQIGGCNLSILQTVAVTAKKGNCKLAVNAGFFNTKKGTCYGNVISDGRKAHSSQGIQNAHFGITKDGQIFTGYLSEEQYNSGDFEQLVGGVLWVLRNNSGFVNVSKRLECEDVQETGSMEQFVDALSARTIVGHDEKGNVIIVQIDGKTRVDGILLSELEDLLKELGIVNAINIDGGGSSSLVIDGITVNYPYDICPDGVFSCDRQVSTILCIHDPYCVPRTCNNHGVCSMGECICQKNYLPPSCAELFCEKSNCSNHGVCLPEGCACHPGYFGENCDKACPDGWYGLMCSQRCDCLNGASCDSISGSCNCALGFTGKRCDSKCKSGYFGVNCQSKCLCKEDCFCDHETGSCEVPQNSSFYHAAKCFANSIIEQEHLVKDNIEEKRKWYTTVIILGVITSLCLTAFLLVLCCSCSCRCRNDQVLWSKTSRNKFRKVPLHLPSGDLSDSMSENEIFPMKAMQKS